MADRAHPRLWEQDRRNDPLGDKGCGRVQSGCRRIAAFPGGSNVTDLVAADGSNKAAVVAEVDDLDAFNAFMASPPPEMAAQAESHGVVMPPATLYVEA